MTCSDCGKNTVEQIVAMVYVARDGSAVSDEGFTGIVWCAECAPTHHKGIVDDFARVGRA